MSLADFIRFVFNVDSVAALHLNWEKFAFSLIWFYQILPRDFLAVRDADTNLVSDWVSRLQSDTAGTSSNKLELSCAKILMDKQYK